MEVIPKGNKMKIKKHIIYPFFGSLIYLAIAGCQNSNDNTKISFLDNTKEKSIGLRHGNHADIGVIVQSGYLRKIEAKPISQSGDISIKYSGCVDLDTGEICKLNISVTTGAIIGHIESLSISAEKSNNIILNTTIMPILMEK